MPRSRDTYEDRRAHGLALRNDLWTTNVFLANLGRIEHAGDVARSGIEARWPSGGNGDSK